MGKPSKNKRKPAQLEPVKATNQNPTTEAQKVSCHRLGSKLERFQPVTFETDPTTKKVSLQGQGEAETSLQMFETTGIHDLGAGALLLAQAYKAQPENMANWGNIAQLMHEIAPQDGLEGMLASQMVAVHNMAMSCAYRSMVKDQRTEVIERNINRVTKLMRTFTAQMEALQRYRSKGQQKITVQHVQINQGGQAVIGNVHPKTGG